LTRPWPSGVDTGRRKGKKKGGKSLSENTPGRGTQLILLVSGQSARDNPTQKLLHIRLPVPATLLVTFVQIIKQLNEASNPGKKILLWAFPLEPGELATWRKTPGWCRDCLAIAITIIKLCPIGAALRVLGELTALGISALEFNSQVERGSRKEAQVAARVTCYTSGQRQQQCRVCLWSK
jgi:hypothetical protein